MTADYHVHLDKYEWTLKSLENICESAAQNGIDKVGIVVHTKILKGFEPLYSHVLSDGRGHRKLTFHRDAEEYVKVLVKAKEEGYPVDMGIEVCYSPEGEDFLRTKLLEYPFDFATGSVHLIGSMHYKNAVSYYKDKNAVGDMYYNLILRAAESRLFNIIGHIEIARREGIPGLYSYPKLLEKICSVLVKNNCHIEINTKSLSRFGSLLPDKKTLDYMLDAGVRLVFSSDAHHLRRIGFARRIAELTIKDSGYEEFCIIR